MIVTRAEMEQYRRDLQAYDLRLAEWLGLDPAQVTALVEVAERSGIRALRVSWDSIAPQEPRHGVDLRRGSTSTDSETMFDESVLLLRDDVDAMRAAVGERPVMPGQAELDAFARAAAAHSIEGPVDLWPRCALCGGPVDLFAVQGQGAASCSCGLILYEDGGHRWEPAT